MNGATVAQAQQKTENLKKGLKHYPASPLYFVHNLSRNPMIAKKATKLLLSRNTPIVSISGVLPKYSVVALFSSVLHYLWLWCMI